mgnify:CR=1 FL=1
MTAPSFPFQEQDMSIQSINARNQFRGKIKEIILGPVVSLSLIHI